MSTKVRSAVSRRNSIFPGWWILLAGALQFGWAGGAGMRSLGIYMAPLQETMGWTRTQISVAASLQRFEGGFEAFPVGVAADKWGPRALQLIAVTIFGGSLIAMYFVNSLWMFYAIWVLSATGFNSGYFHVLDKAVADWFVRRRGLILGIMRAVGSGITPLVLMLISWLIYNVGWREGFLVTGVATLVTGLPLTWLFIKPKRPEYYGWLPDSERVEEGIASDTEATIRVGVGYAAEVGEVEFSLRQVIKTRLFWIYTGFVAIHILGLPVISLHLIPHLTDIGLDPTVALGIYGVMIWAEIPGRLLGGWLADLVHTGQLKYAVMVGTFLQGLAILLLAYLPSLAWLWVFVVLFGMSSAFGIAVLPPMRARFWGRKAFATIHGAALTITMFVGILGPIYAGWTYDTFGSYWSAFMVLSALMLVGVALAFFLNPPKPPERIGKITEFF